MVVRYFYKIITFLLLVSIVLLAFFIGYVGILKTYVYPLKYREEIFLYSENYNLDKALVFSVVKVESDFREKAVSSKGAKGLMQITDKTANYIALLKKDSDFDMLKSKQNIEYGCYYLRYLMDKFSDTKTALVAYNAGEGKVKTWLKDKQYSSNGITLDYIEYTETREYVEKIEKTFKIYKKLYGNLLDKQ